MKLGQAISSIEFSDTEKDRIGAAMLEEGTLPFKVLNSKINTINDMDFWRRAQKRMGINGFRDGHPKAQSMVLERALNNLRRSSGSAYSDIWLIYRRCAINYIVDDLSKLNKLLLVEDLVESDGSLTEQIFRSINPLMFLYQTNFEEAQQLYELWGFERVADFRKLFAEQGVSGESVRRLVSLECENIRTKLGEEIGEVKAGILKLVSVEKQRVSSIIERLDSVEKNIEKAISTLRSELQNPNEKLLQKKVEEIDDKIKKVAQENSILLTSSVGVKGEELIIIQSQLDDLSRTLHEHSAALSSKTNSIEEPTQVDNLNIQIEIGIFFENWLKVFKELGVSNVDNGILWLVLQIYRRAKIIISSRPTLLSGLFKSFPQYELKSITASPMWTSVTDWTEAYEFISVPSKTPRLLIISDFDVGIQEAYLVPSLRNLLNSEFNRCNRVILVPSKSDCSAVSDRLLEFCIHFELESAWFEGLGKLRDKLNRKYEGFPPEGDVLEVFGFLENANLDYEKDLKKLASNTGVILPPVLVSQFTNLHAGLAALGDQAWQISSEIALLPWVQAVKGDNFKKIFDETLKASLTGAA